jgi:hypothetical protein
MAAFSETGFSQANYGFTSSLCRFSVKVPCANRMLKNRKIRLLAS